MRNLRPIVLATCVGLTLVAGCARKTETPTSAAVSRKIGYVRMDVLLSLIHI